MNPILNDPLRAAAMSRAPVHPQSERSRNPYDALRPWSAITHGAGAVLAALGTLFLLLQANSRQHRLAFAVYGLSMVALYAASTLYHSIRTSPSGRKRLRKLDHCCIYLLIAGSYTPFCLLALKNTCGRVLLMVIWFLALGGIVLSTVWITAPRWLTAGSYLLMGWIALFAIVPLSRVLPGPGMAGLIAGGILYSIGGVLYALKWPGRNHPRFGCHEIFHVFILLGSAVHFWVMYDIVALL